MARMKGNASKISPSTLFQEIHSYIKGSHMALDKPQGFLSRDEYLRLPNKMAPNFRGLRLDERQEDLSGERAGSRNTVYDMFEMYEELKRKMQAYDNADLIHHVWKGLEKKAKDFERFQHSASEDIRVDSIFVDEAQVQSDLLCFIGNSRNVTLLLCDGRTLHKLS